MYKFDEVFIRSVIEKQQKSLMPIIEDEGCAIITTVVDGHHGIHVGEILFKLLGIEDALSPDDEWYYDEIERILSDFNDEMGESLKDDSYYVGWNDTDGSLDLFYGTCKEDEQ